MSLSVLREFCCSSSLMLPSSLSIVSLQPVLMVLLVGLMFWPGYFPSAEWIGGPLCKPVTWLLKHPPLEVENVRKCRPLRRLCGHRSSKLAKRNTRWEFPEWQCKILSTRHPASPCSYFECSLNCFMSSAVLTSRSINFYVYYCITSLTSW